MPAGRPPDAASSATMIARLGAGRPVASFLAWIGLILAAASAPGLAAARSETAALLAIETEVPRGADGLDRAERPKALDGTELDDVEAAINAERWAHGLAPLAMDTRLRTAAGGHADDLAARGACGHGGGDGSSPGERMLRAGYPNPYGEIVACGFPDVPTVVDAWMNSPGHRAIILCDPCTELGAGFTRTGSGYQFYWVVNFGLEPVDTPTPGSTSTSPPVPTSTRTATSTSTGTPVPTSTRTATASATMSPAATATASNTPAASATATEGASRTPVPSTTPSATRLPLPSPSPPATIVPGDTNCDTVRSAIDARFVLQYAVGMRDAAWVCPLEPGSLYEPGCHTDAGTDCNAADALRILQCEIGLPNALCPAGRLGALPLGEAGQQILGHPALRSGLGPRAIRVGTAIAPQARRALDASSDPDVLVEVGYRRVGPGQQVSVPITLTARAGIEVGALELELRFDPRLATPLACRLDTGIGSCNPRFEADGLSEDSVKLSLAAAQGLRGSTLLAWIDFVGPSESPPADAEAQLNPILNVLVDDRGQALSSAVEAGRLRWQLPATATQATDPRETATRPPTARATMLPTQSPSLARSLLLPMLIRRR